MANEATVTLRIFADGSLAIEQMGKVMSRMKRMESVTGGIVGTIKTRWFGISAVITGSLILIKKAWDLMEPAAQYEEQMDSLNRLAAGYNTTASSIVSDIQRAAKGMISMQDAANVAGNAMMKYMKPDQLVKLAEASETLSNVSGKKVIEHFQELSESLATGKERALKLTMGIVDLEAKYGEAVNTMSDAEKAQKLYNMVIEHTDRLQQSLGESTDSTGDKMERLTTQVKDLQLIIGQGLIRAMAGAYGAFQWLAAGALQFAGYLQKVGQAVAWFGEKTSITDTQREHFRALKEEAKQTASDLFGAASDLTGKAMDNFKAMTVSKEELASAMAKPFKAAEDAYHRSAKAAKKEKDESNLLKKAYEERCNQLERERKMHEEIARVMMEDEVQASSNIIDMEKKRIELAERAGYISGREAIEQTIAQEEKLLDLEQQRIDLMAIQAITEEEQMETYPKQLAAIIELEERRAELQREKVYRLDALQIENIDKMNDLYERQKDLRAREYENSFSFLFDTGAEGAGMNTFASGFKGFFDVYTGQDETARKLAEKRDMYKETLSAYENGLITETEMEIAACEMQVSEERYYQDRKLNMTGHVFDMLCGMAEAYYGMAEKEGVAAYQIYKAVKIASTIYHTISAAIKAYRAMMNIPYAGEYLAAIAFAVTMAFGMAQVAIIASTNPGSSQAPVSYGGSYSSAAASFTSSHEAEQEMIVNIHIDGNIISNTTTGRLTEQIREAWEEAA